jgi:hypothetical protein
MASKKKGTESKKNTIKKRGRLSKKPPLPPKHLMLKQKKRPVPLSLFQFSPFPGNRAQNQDKKEKTANPFIFVTKEGSLFFFIPPLRAVPERPPIFLARKKKRKERKERINKEKGMNEEEIKSGKGPKS